MYVCVLPESRLIIGVSAYSKINTLFIYLLGNSI